MAERKTFLFFCGWAEALADFSPEDRCAVYDAVIAYAEGGTVPSLNPVAQMAFKFIKKDIDDMQTKYDAVCEQRREAANKRWQKMGKQSDDTNGAKDTIASNLCNSMHEHDLHYKHEHKHGHEHKHEHGHKHKHNQSVSHRGEGLTDGSSLAEQIACCKNSPIWKQGVCSKFDIDSEAEIDRLLDEFANDMICKEVEVRQAKRLFLSWMAEHHKRPKPEAEAEAGLGIGEWRDDNGRRRYGQSDVVVPDSAPPRPGEAFWWNEAMNGWCDMI